ncbi:DUF4159 domain-containing protein [Telmatospirillum sp. J64-1]|uniref:DUF4159 domain-containing protein n=1 Tax=Telmatospirillum sp. J64-1 TaxID=2502183 RepID=UPI00115DD9B6|nr:DUF4159 domain-containing protein [Telmatospirillum sp. J64-1]
MFGLPALSLPALSFAAPWVLAALLTLPMLWWLLRAMPPSPKRQSFPAIRLLFGLNPREDVAARTPLWVVLMRMLLAALVILAAAHPVINSARPLAGDGPLLVAVDDGWAAARNWSARRAALEALMDRAERQSRPVILLPTAPPADGGPINAIGPLPAREARPLAQAMAPKPWSADRAAATEALGRLTLASSVSAFWLSDGVDAGPPGAASGFALALQRLGGGLEVMAEPPGGLARLVLPPVREGGDLVPTVRRPAAGPEETLYLRAVDDSGRVVGREAVTIPAGETQVAAHISLPAELRNRVVRLDIEDEAGAGSVALLDERWRRRPVGVVSGLPQQADAPLLSDVYYLERALAPYADLRRGEIRDLLSRELSVMILADVGQMAQPTIAELGRWVEGGGVLLRFAGPNLARLADAEQADDPLLPVRLRAGGRSLGGAMSWSEPLGLAPFPDYGPFAGLTAPADVRVERQVLAQPAIDLNERTWARLSDGTPLVTAMQRGEGWVILVHTTPNAMWSDLPLSGVFVDMLRRIVDLSQGLAGAQTQNALPPAELLDGFGRLQPARGAVTSLRPEALAETMPGPRNPPGWYGDASARRALNLAPHIGETAALTVPRGVGIRGYADAPRELDLKPWLIGAALILAIIDTIVALALRGLLPTVRRRAAAGAGAVLLALAILAAMPGTAQAQEAEVDMDFALRAALETRLAYVLTGNPEVDRISEAGLHGLTEVLYQRSSAELAEPMAVDVERDMLLFFPVIYWPVTEDQPPPSPEAQARINDYLRNGGMILFDSGPMGSGSDASAGAALQRLTEGLSIPPLQPLPDDHVLTRTFFLMDEMPGRWTGATIWVESGESGRNDNVTPVVIGGNDWAAAWARDERRQPLFATVPGGERQRELAYRFGVNLVIHALTGNYKEDQVHIPIILERLGQ